MKKTIYILTVVLSFSMFFFSAEGKELFRKDSVSEANKWVELTEAAVPVKVGSKHEISFQGSTDGKYNVEEDARIRLMNLKGVASSVRVRFYDGQGNEVKGYIDVPVITHEVADYVRAFYPPSQSVTLKVFLLPSKGAKLSVGKAAVMTDLDGKEGECINIHPVFERGDLNFYGYDPGYGGGFYTRPDGRTVWNSGFIGSSPSFPVKEGVSYDFYCRGKNGERKASVLLNCYNAQGGKPFKNMPLKFSEKGAAETFPMPAGTVSANLTCYYVILEEFRVTESSTNK